MKIGIKGLLFGVVSAIILIGTPVFADDIVKNIQVKFNEILLEVNGEKVGADNILYNGTTYVPFRTVAELLDKNVEYISSTATASITDKYYAKKNYEIDLIEEDANRIKKDTEGIANLSDSIVQINTYNDSINLKTGSGVCINNDGFILTNYHVISYGNSFEVIINDEKKSNHYAELIYYDKDDDLALLKIDTESKGLQISKEKPNVGSKVVAIGSPLGIYNTVSEGIISGFSNINGLDSIIMSAPISEGSSGGALLNMYGEVVGITYGSYEGGENLNLAIPSDVILDFLNRAEYSNIKILSYPDGWYVGEVKDGKRYGYGTMYWDNGEMYIGYFLNDNLDEKYLNYVYDNGDIYSGRLVDGVPDGLGNFIPRYSIYGYNYTGEFVAGKKTGIGNFKFPARGQSYIGYVENGRYEGYGFYEYGSGKVSFANWSKDKKVGNFVGVDSDGEMNVYRDVNDDWVKVK